MAEPRIREPYLNLSMDNGEVVISSFSSDHSISVKIDPVRKEFIISLVKPPNHWRDLLEIVGFDGELGR